MARVLVVGSVARDEVVRLRRPLVAGRHIEGYPGETRLGGGAACTGVPLALAGHQVSLISPIGDDAAGQGIIEELEAAQVDTSQLSHVQTASTKSLVLVDASGERTVINLARARESQPPTRLLDLPADCLYVRSRAEALASLLADKARSCLVVAHIPPCAEGTRPAHVLVGSESDLDGALLGSPWQRGQRIAGDRPRWVVITRGARGATAFGAQEQLSVPAPATRAQDTTGAGDSFAAGLIHALLNEIPMREALTTACAWGAAKAGSRGSVLSAEAVERLVR